MKKYITLLTIMMVAILATSCGTSKYVAVSNDPYEAVGEGYANDPNEAKNMAFTYAVAEIERKSGVNVVDETKSTYQQKQTGVAKHDSSSAVHQVRTLSDGTLVDLVVSYKPISSRKCRQHGVTDGYEATVRVSPENVTTYVNQ